MPLTYKTNAGAGDFKPIPAGSHVAICDIVADVGLQPGSGLYPAPKQQVYLRFQIPAERVEYERDGRKLEGPAVIGQFFTASMHEKARLRKALEGWRGRQFTDPEAEAFDLEKVLGKPCMLSVVHNVKDGKTYANIASLSLLPKGFTASKHEGDLLFYAESDTRQYKMLPEWLQKKIDGQLTKQKEEPLDQPISEHDEGDPLTITDDDIPF